MSLTVRRIINVVISIVLGFFFTHLSLWLMNTNPDEYGLYFGTEGDGLAYYPLTIISFAFFFGLWIDKFIGSDFLPK